MSEGLKPPADAGAEGWHWNAWAKEMASMAFPGWSPCRFAHRTGAVGQPEMARFVFGIVRGPFGIWEKPYDVCRWDNESPVTARQSERLFALTHLPTGHGAGLFERVDYAALAADTAVRATAEWNGELISPEAINRTFECWQKVGIAGATNAHAHDNGSAVFKILSIATIEDGRPEKLS